jgi:hypothetical protein
MTNEEQTRERGFIEFLHNRLAAHEGGAGSIHIGYDDATREYVISQKSLYGTRQDVVLGCASSLVRAIDLAVAGKEAFDE